ncbi:MAG: transporter substrate-binding domain-containing protein [Methanosarcinaceae archaeon]|nr:transporter substrate-binding domain-containing protein [Methanosarcinaceae archaeon]
MVLRFNTKKAFGALLLIFLVCTAVTVSVSAADKGKITSVDDLPGKIIGVQLGTTGDIYATDYEGDDAGTKIERYNKAADAVMSLKQGKIDCIIIDEQPAIVFVSKNDDLMILDEEFTSEEYAICVKKGNTELLSKINVALNTLREDGTLVRINKNYIGTDDEKGTMPYVKKNISRPNGTLVVATNAEFPPYEYFDNGEITGIDMDIMQAVCDELGMELKIENMEFDSIITAVNAGKADVGAAGMTVTEDRLKNIDFSESYTTSKQVIIVRKDEDNEKKTPFIGVAGAVFSVFAAGLLLRRRNE